MVIFSITILKSQLCSKTQKIDPNFWTPLPPGGMGGYPPEKVKNDPKMTQIWTNFGMNFDKKRHQKTQAEGYLRNLHFEKKWSKNDQKVTIGWDLQVQKI